MITEIVTFPLPADLGRDEVRALYEASAPIWQANPDLLRKNYLHDPVSGKGGGVYTWKTIEAAKAAHGEEFRTRIREKFGADPEFAYFETPLLIENEHG